MFITLNTTIIGLVSGSVGIVSSKLLFDYLETRKTRKEYEKLLQSFEDYACNSLVIEFPDWDSNEICTDYEPFRVIHFESIY